MDTQCTTSTNPEYAVNFSSGALGSGNGDGLMSDEEEQEEEVDEEQPRGNGRTPASARHSPPAVTAPTDWTSNNEGEAVYSSRYTHGVNPESGFSGN